MFGSVVASCGIPGILTAEPGRVETGGSEKAPAGENDIGGRGRAEGKADGRVFPAGVNSAGSVCLFANEMFGRGGIDIPGSAKL